MNAVMPPMWRAGGPALPTQQEESYTLLARARTCTPFRRLLIAEPGKAAERRPGLDSSMLSSTRKERVAEGRSNAFCSKERNTK